MEIHKNLEEVESQNMDNNGEPKHFVALETPSAHLEMSLPAIIGAVNQKTIRVKVTVENWLLIVLIDSESTQLP